MIKESGRVVYMNGELVKELDAKISIYDSALMFGDMVFEMTRSFNKKQFKLREHLQRLLESVRYAHIPFKMTIDELEAACQQTIEANEPLFNNNDEHRLMINISRGPLSLYAPVFGGVMQPTVVIADFPLKWTVAAMAPLFDMGINAVIPSQRAIPASLLEPKVKNRSRIHYMMANIEVAQCKGENNWALLLDPDGFVAEGTGDNFFIVKDNVIITPEPRNILRGISRAYIFELAEQLGIPCVEKNIEPFDVMMADEAFMTATPFCILPVTGLNGGKIGAGCKGAVTQRLLHQWSDNVGVDIEQQIKDYAKELSEPNVKAPSPYQFETIDD
ncbi:MAG: aminotransferase class IV [Coxiellaceae bacterium]|nr:aminotransferase class IV [Coxiellaceae bacterium]